MKYQWLKDDEEPLSDGEDYKGTTTAELVIVGTGPHVKRSYKCLVKHKYGEILSREAQYGECLLTAQCTRGFTITVFIIQTPSTVCWPLKKLVKM